VATGITLTVTDWPTDGEALYAVRHAVFIVEQHVPRELEVDAADRTARHVLARDAAGRPIATGRLLPDGHIGRLAVLAPWRGRGLGRRLLAALIDLARAQGLAEVVASAQVRAAPFYSAAGFVAEGDVYDDAGIPHRDMRLVLRHRAAGSPTDP
jgi:predicted GNAT family N-acyltransferase